MRSGWSSRARWPKHVSGPAEHTKGPCGAPLPGARRQREPAETSPPDGGTRAAHARSTERQRDAPELGRRRTASLCSGADSTPDLASCASTETSPPSNFTNAFVYFEVGLGGFIEQTAAREQRGHRAPRKGGLAGFHPAAITRVAMVLRGNIPPAAAVSHKQRKNSLFSASSSSPYSPS